jgi:hypothetical protein
MQQLLNCFLFQNFRSVWGAWDMNFCNDGKLEIQQSSTEKMYNHIHRRKSSSDEDHSLTLLPNGDPQYQTQQTELQSNGHHKSVTPSLSNASRPALDPPPSTGPYCASYGALSPRPGPLSPLSSFRSTSFGHARSDSRGGGSVSSFAPSLSLPSFPGQHVRTALMGICGMDSLLPTTAPFSAHTHDSLLPVRNLDGSLLRYT